MKHLITAKKNNANKLRVYNGGRKIPGYSLDKRNNLMSNGQIKEWILELIAGAEHFFYMLGVLDVFEREILDYYIVFSCEGKDTFGKENYYQRIRNK